MTENLEQQGAQLVLFVRRGPSECALRFFMGGGYKELEFRVMPSLYRQEDSGQHSVKPLLERMLTVTVDPATIETVQPGDTRYFRIMGRLKTRLQYADKLPDDALPAWAQVIEPNALVFINYDCEDRVGELYLGGIIPFPANFQCISMQHNDGGDYHLVRPL